MGVVQHVDVNPYRAVLHRSETVRDVEYVGNSIYVPPVSSRKQEPGAEEVLETRVGRRKFKEEKKNEAA